MVSEEILGVIGSGQIGSRHLQALAKIDRPIKIQVVDPSEESRQLAKSRFRQVKGTGNVKNIEFLSKISEMDPELAWVLISTNANIRRQVIEELVNKKSVQYLLLEKVVFQQEEDFEIINTLLKEEGISAWVNFARRAWPIYQELKAFVKAKKLINFNVNGSNWGLGCNGLHFYDLFVFMTDDYVKKFSTKLLDPEVIPSKREGFLEFTGCIFGHSQHNQIALYSYSKSNAPLQVQFTSPTERFIVNENENIVWLSNKENDWDWIKKPFSPIYQSQITHKVVQEILDTGKCILPTYKEAWKLHIPFLRALIEQLNKNSIDKEIKTCPIT